ncbi:2Fe-2S iron-sulfur cluster binding domain-containing protein [Sinimarinibacterium sp. CAU 1509]|uniref:2Fe-2S iron-sulfur cluster-binding protein n=1 Tax=Sinimarinibacterium sp. CAU 1509 TaxID=2562283 RepID=UPI0010ABC894|nr:2Fe-2S iron-sulfur cluster binding domain-containing protein [Sinimarinibacterium sp. CAU 1509]TJY59478.1 2Fe-2S iron-sulfur cluster binding domain-containing protein [Sinimarinibacterium sp. CAU 1509]
MLSRLFRRSAVDCTMRIVPAGREVKVNAKSTLLQAALDQSIPFPHDCRAGGCGKCKCRLVSGKVRELTDKSYILSAEELKQNYILACQSTAQTDVTVEVDIDARGRPAHPVIHTRGEITALDPLTHDIMRVQARLEDPAIYTAGQYAEIYVPGVIKDGAREARSYSFASAPGTAGTVGTVSFFIRRVPGGGFTEWLFNEAKVGTVLEGHGPYGDFWLRPGDAPLLCIAGGSGLAPILALLEQAQIEGVTRDVTLFFGARAQRDLYALDRIEALKANWHGKFAFEPVLSAETDDSGWTGRRGFIPEHFEAVLGTRIGQHHAYLCGPPPMIDACIKVLNDAGIGEEGIFFDKFLDRSHVVEA